MSVPFQKIGLFAKYNDPSVAEIFSELIQYLTEHNYSISIEAQSATLLANPKVKIVSLEKLGKINDLVIVLGGDGSILNAARAIVQYQVPILGINRGRLGFLADIHPSEFKIKLTEILKGTYSVENRVLLKTSILRDNKLIAASPALNDSVLYTSDVARMLDFEVRINQQLVLKQRADGLIVSTPTGSTAYALSAGGPILYPTLQAFTLAPMLPHTLTSRPIVIDNNATIELIIAPENEVQPKISCDGQVHLDIDLNKKDTVHIEKYPFELQLIHPKSHNYFEVLRKKLGWSTHLSSDRFSTNDS